MKHLLMNLIMLLIVVGLNVNLCNATPLVFDDIEFDLTNAGEMDVSIASNALCPSGNELQTHPPNFNNHKNESKHGKGHGVSAPVPEPATMLLFGLGLILMVVIMKRKINMKRITNNC